MYRQGFIPEAFLECGWRSGSSLPFPETWQPLNSCHHPQQTMSKARRGQLQRRERLSRGTAGSWLVTRKQPRLLVSRTPW